MQFQRAAGVHAAAKETIALAEQRFLTNSKHWEFDNAWQEMLNHATMKVREGLSKLRKQRIWFYSNTLLQVMDAEKQKTVSEAEHLRRADAFQVQYNIYPECVSLLFLKTEQEP